MMNRLLAYLLVAIPIAAHAQTPEEIEIVAGEIVPEHLRPLALTDQQAMIEAWVGYEMDRILQQMVDRGADRADAGAALENATASFRDLIETDWYGRLESFANRDPRFADLTDDDLLDLAEAAQSDDQACARADYLIEFHGRNERARADMLPTAREAQQACRDGQ